MTKTKDLAASVRIIRNTGTWYLLVYRPEHVEHNKNNTINRLRAVLPSACMYKNSWA